MISAHGYRTFSNGLTYVHHRVDAHMTSEALSELTKSDTLHVGINLGGVLVNGTSPTGDPAGVAPDIAAALAEHLGVSCSYLNYATPSEVADALARGECDIGLVADDPKRAETITFCDAYVEIEASYLVPANSPFQSIDDVDQPGVRIAVAERSANDLYLSRNLKQAELCRAEGFPRALGAFATDKLDALAGAVPQLLDGAKKLPGSRIIDGNYTTVRQAIATKREAVALKVEIDQFLGEAKASGLVATLIETHGVAGQLKVASDP